MEQPTRNIGWAIERLREGKMVLAKGIQLEMVNAKGGMPFILDLEHRVAWVPTQEQLFACDYITWDEAIGEMRAAETLHEN